MFGSAASKVVSAASKVASSVPLPDITKKETGFSEAEAFKHVKALSQIPSPPSSDHSPLIQYVLDESESIKERAKGNVKVEVDRVPAKYGESVVLKVSPKNESEAEKENAILVSAHVDTVFTYNRSEGDGGDENSNVAVMLELARGLSQSSASYTGFKNSVIFVFNMGDEEALDASHSFITQHSFSDNVRLAVDLDSIGFTKSSTSEGTGSKNPVVFMSKIGEEGNAAEKLILDLAAFSNHPGGKHTESHQDLFSSGFIKSATHFKVIKEVADISGLDFEFTDSTAVYHTKNDKLELLKPGSFQHLGDNMLAFLIEAASHDLLE